jgi:hypothetical protein
MPDENSDEPKTMKDFMDRVTLCHKYIKTMNLGTDNLTEMKKSINTVVENREKGINFLFGIAW